MAKADSNTRQVILELALDPVHVLVDEHALGPMQTDKITLYDVCDAICDCIRNGGRVKQTVVKTHPKGLVGQPAYELKQRILGKMYYIRVTLVRLVPEALMILSVHLDL